MLAEDRLAQIVELVNTRGSVTVPELAQRFDTSESTIRRDLEKLDQAHCLVKVHGGASSNNNAVVAHAYVTQDTAMGERRSLNAAEKDALATWAAAQINGNDFVFIDAGSTTQAIVAKLKGEALRATYVTNSVSTALELAGRGCHTLVLGGDLKDITEAIVGPGAIDALANYNFTKGFWGANGVSLNQGFSTPEPDEAMVKRLSMQHSLDCYVLADSSKIDAVAPVTFCNFADAILVTTAPLKPTYSSCPNIVEVNA